MDWKRGLSEGAPVRQRVCGSQSLSPALRRKHICLKLHLVAVAVEVVEVHAHTS